MEGDEFEPSCHPSFVGCVACWAFAVSVCTVVGTRVHEVPVVHAESSTVAGIVEIGQSEAVAELVACTAYAVELCASVAGEFAAHGVGVDAFAAKVDGAVAVVIVSTLVECPHV